MITVFTIQIIIIKTFQATLGSNMRILNIDVMRSIKFKIDIVFYSACCESLVRSVVNGFDPQDEWRPNHELKSSQHEQTEISRKRNHLTVSVPIINEMRGKMKVYSLLMKSMKNTKKRKRKTSRQTRHRQGLDRT